MAVSKMTKEGVTLTINGRELNVKPFTWKELGKFESFIKSQHIAELHEALELTKPPYPPEIANLRAYPPGTALPPAVVKYQEWLNFKETATQNILRSDITGEDMAIAENSFNGKLFIVRHGLRDNPDIEAIMEELSDMSNQEMSRANIRLIQQAMEPGGQDENPPEPPPETAPESG